MVGDPFNGSKIGSDTILECGFGPNSTPKASSKGEGCPPLIYSILTLSLVNVRLVFFPIPINTLFCSRFKFTLVWFISVNKNNAPKFS